MLYGIIGVDAVYSRVLIRERQEGPTQRRCDDRLRAAVKWGHERGVQTSSRTGKGNTVGSPREPPGGARPC